ncbi:response regulator transcription factor [Novosphingobium sp. SL115]|uniref:response regulator n=1 Tax=Novosphingobium sp. SL115 TaxID=2995150 RepID=UPI00227316BF|nr:response regulator transcription factor [Novosphingobium sp. SL115]MCY1672081.1 response regulator transcription factor [Novosphingobium sp. SL115]
MRLLIVEDNARLAALVAGPLRHAGYACDLAQSLEQADAAVAVVRYDAVVLDLGLPDGDGMNWLKARRTGGFDVPVLVLTARGALNDRITGLDSGADDYLVKPAATDEIAARIRALLRRPGGRASPVLQVGDLLFDAAARRAHFAGTLLDLTRRETDLLELLMRQAGTVVRRERIETALYGFDEEVSPNAIEAVVSRLRRRLQALGGGEMIHTLRGLGYLLQDQAA